MSSEKNEHTPGPLEVAAEPFGDNEYMTEVVVPGRAGGFGTSVATCHHNWREAVAGERKISWAEAQANARLYSAAPELLEALEGLLVFAEDAETKALVGDEGCLWPCEEARAAIAKARGDAMLAARSENNGE